MNQSEIDRYGKIVCVWMMVVVHFGGRIGGDVQQKRVEVIRDVCEWDECWMTNRIVFVVPQLNSFSQCLMYHHLTRAVPSMQFSLRSRSLVTPKNSAQKQKQKKQQN